MKMAKFKNEKLKNCSLNKKSEVSCDLNKNLNFAEKFNSYSFIKNEIFKNEISHGLFVVSTPIGNMDDITIRALKVLQKADIVLCEDTRVTNKLLSQFNMKKSMITYNDHNFKKVEKIIIEKLLEKKIVALVSDAGTPLISDPGFELLSLCEKFKIPFTTVPGPSSIISGIILSKFPPNKFLFLGFFDTINESTLLKVSTINFPIIIFESPKKLLKTLFKLSNFFVRRKVSVVREITKIFEETVSGTFEFMIKHFSKNKPRGEIVIVIDGIDFEKEKINEMEIKNELSCLLEKMGGRDAVEFIAKKMSLNKKEVYKHIKNFN